MIEQLAVELNVKRCRFKDLASFLYTVITVTKGQSASLTFVHLRLAVVLEVVYIIVEGIRFTTRTAPYSDIMTCAASMLFCKLEYDVGVMIVIFSVLPTIITVRTGCNDHISVCTRRAVHYEVILVNVFFVNIRTLISVYLFTVYKVNYSFCVCILTVLILLAIGGINVLHCLTIVAFVYTTLVSATLLLDPITPNVVNIAIEFSVAYSTI
jgi:hypothetical protein